MGRKDLGHLNITCVIRREKAIKGDQEGIAADVGWGGRTRQLVSLTSRDKSMKKEGLLNCATSYREARKGEKVTVDGAGSLMTSTTGVGSWRTDFGVGRSEGMCLKCFRKEAACHVTPASWPQVGVTGEDSSPKLSQLD